ncbi:hypothetical protein W97_01161 [Coniosporium apollinis CBS 100218]|uniref:Methyltransferase type 11 domain-containing protein n=1 Tax=Coniosporium apollinis (strain CBS 100218) TaxID=1168221 RepID=R7YJ84_CONA1|nr:uncharacterized protein W97_01161 [Coniosporium apollinis CBS 100218]EON61943.1 hypothetical protein W97_01161 [Coniosporium apollinis CBS 100218]
MDSYMLPATVYNPNCPVTTYIASPLARRDTLNTIIEDEPQIDMEYFPVPPLPMRATMLSPTYSEDFPTPRAQDSLLALYEHTPVSPASDMSESAPWRKSREDPEFDDLYDVTDSETEDVPLTCSNSVKKISAHSSQASSARTSRSRYPSLVIPSPSAWPTIEKLKTSAFSPMQPTPIMQVAPKREFLSMLAARNLQVPARSATPSLDGSMTSDELDKLSCPSTPDIERQAEKQGDWAGPVQLHPDAMETLHHLSMEDPHEQAVNQILEASDAEMQQLSGGHPHNSIDILVTPVDEDDDDCVSALSVPSPGGFFSSLRNSARKTWWRRPGEDSLPTTSIAENFYGVPWETRPDNPVEHIVEVAPPVSEVLSEDPATARQLFSPEVAEVMEIKPSETKYEYNENYHQELEKMASLNIDRTGLWLSAQETYSASPQETETMSIGSVMSPITKTHSRESSLEQSIRSPFKKSVRFAEDGVKSPSVASNEPISPKESTFLEGFQYMRERSHKSDAFVHRQTRAEAVHIQRRCMPQAHRDQLLGRYELNNPLQAARRPISHWFPEEASEEKELVAKVQKERQALELMAPAHWTLEAAKFLNGGRLLCKAAHQQISRNRTGSARILDLGGQASCDWAWQTALDYSNASVITASTTFQPTDIFIKSPENHRQVTVPNLWTLPFPKNHFDVISARSLHTFLKIRKPAGKGQDEYDLCLQECLRCLKPGGFLEFEMLDADILHAGTQASAMSVEFGFNLKTRGYDPAPTKSFVSRLSKAGFGGVKRAWMVLPMASTGAKWTDKVDARVEKSIGADGEVEEVSMGTSKDAAAMAGLVGSWAWEKWLLKLQMEMGKEEERLLEGVAAALEEGAKQGSAWRCLSGWARKGM